MSNKWIFRVLQKSQSPERSSNGSGSSSSSSSISSSISSKASAENGRLSPRRSRWSWGFAKRDGTSSATTDEPRTHVTGAWPEVALTPKRKDIDPRAATTTTHLCTSSTPPDVLDATTSRRSTTTTQLQSSHDTSVSSPLEIALRERDPYTRAAGTMRLTRSQLREATTIHADDTAILEGPAISEPLVPDDERVPLGETTANAAQNILEAVDMPAKNATKPTRGRKGKGGKRGKRAEDEVEDEQEQKGVDVDDAAADESPASEENAEEQKAEGLEEETEQAPAAAEEIPLSRAARIMRRQRAKEEETLSKSQSTTPPEVRVEDVDEVAQELAEKQKVLVAELRPQVTNTSTSDDTRTGPASERSSGSSSPETLRARLETSIEAIDALEEALEDISKSIPNLRRSCNGNVRLAADEDHLSGSDSDSSVPAKASMQKRSEAPQGPKSAKENAVAKPARPVVKKPVAPTRKPVAPAPKPTATTMKPGLSRSSSVKTPSTSSCDSSVRPRGNGEVTDYLAAKRRPISMSFPTPAPPAKSAKPPTRPTFQLPGEAVAARLKAQREERLKREEEEAKKKREFKARPAPKAVVAPSAVKDTKASKARESLMHGGPVASATGPSADAARAAKRASLASTIKFRVPSMLTREPTGKAAAATAAAAAATVTAEDVAVQREKGKQIFNRDKLEKEERERMRREKEEAAKRARAEAAERGRQASREWAEKQKRKLMALASVKSAN